MQFRESILNEDNPNFTFNNVDMYQANVQYDPFYQNILNCH